MRTKIKRDKNLLQNFFIGFIGLVLKDDLNKIYDIGVNFNKGVQHEKKRKIEK